MRIFRFFVILGLCLAYPSKSMQAFQGNIVKTPVQKFAPKRFEPKPYNDYSRARVIMYSQTFCGPCKVKRRQLKAENIPFTEYFIDKDEKRNKEMYALLDKNKMPKSYYGTPMIVLNGEILGNPSISVIKQKLRK